MSYQYRSIAVLLTFGFFSFWIASCIAIGVGPGSPCGIPFGSSRYMAREGQFGCYKCDANEYWNRRIKSCAPCTGFLTNTRANVRSSCKDRRIPVTTTATTTTTNPTASHVSNSTCVDDTTVMMTSHVNASVQVANINVSIDTAFHVSNSTYLDETKILIASHANASTQVTNINALKNDTSTVLMPRKLEGTQGILRHISDKISLLKGKKRRKSKRRNKRKRTKGKAEKKKKLNRIRKKRKGNKKKNLKIKKSHNMKI
uniref:uncharacterized protein LOC120340352 n=1 Tax=Styela clava TaxID=7725 RepID=UPI00193A89F5|nr:uncharacterized protein LOC120340352 [Styela clava]